MNPPPPLYTSNIYVLMDHIIHTPHILLQRKMFDVANTLGFSNTVSNETDIEKRITHKQLYKNNVCLSLLFALVIIDYIQSLSKEKFL